MKSEKFNLYEKITGKIIELLSRHLESWNKPWVLIDQEGGIARNAQSGKAYNGINQMLLSFEALERSYGKSAWLTFNQVKELGGTVLKGEKSTTVIFWKFIYYAKNGKIIPNEEIVKLSEKGKLSSDITKKPMLRYFSVFNVFQTQGLPEKYYHIEKMNIPTEFEKDERAEHLIHSTNAKIVYKHGDRAYYYPATDQITLPIRSQFEGTEAFYETALHELGHWTGHSTRLNRDLKGRFGSKDYAFEELIAELTSAFLCTDLGFSKMITNNAAYIKNWISKLQNDHNYIFQAASQAEKATEFIRAFSIE